MTKAENIWRPEREIEEETAVALEGVTVNRAKPNGLGSTKKKRARSKFIMRGSSFEPQTTGRKAVRRKMVLLQVTKHLCSFANLPHEKK